LPGGFPALTAYDDGTGVWTIGYGHTAGVRPGDTMTAADAERTLELDLGPTAKRVDGMVGIPVAEHQFDALCSFAFNLGVGALRTSLLLQCVNAGNFDGAAAQFPRWDHSGGKELAGLLKRRVAEMHIFTDADYSARP